MKWLLDEMLPPAACQELNLKGHDAVSVRDVGLGAAEDDAIFDFAVREERIVVTENFDDFSVLLQRRLTTNAPCVPVAFVRKSDLPQRGALAVHLARRLDRWADANPGPYVGPHWV